MWNVCFRQNPFHMQWEIKFQITQMEKSFSVFFVFAKVFSSLYRPCKQKTMFNVNFSREKLAVEIYLTLCY
jgi:hypothetical protein